MYIMTARAYIPFQRRRDSCVTAIGGSVRTVKFNYARITLIIWIMSEGIEPSRTRVVFFLEEVEDFLRAERT